mmetsp:Transcript_37334/g.87087  ORF Transcript_37334/g.87087 Transcript_37334/m.87087 type:complete len:253 (-) Transcript_37334:112-870(-)
MKRELKHFCPATCSFDCSCLDDPFFIGGKQREGEENPTCRMLEKIKKESQRMWCKKKIFVYASTRMDFDKDTKYEISFFCQKICNHNNCVVKPTEAPTKNPKEAPTPSPTKKPTAAPTPLPTKKLTEAPTPSPTENPTENPTTSPTKKPTEVPTFQPSSFPSKGPTRAPSNAPSTPSPTINSCKDDPRFEGKYEKGNKTKKLTCAKVKAKAWERWCGEKVWTKEYPKGRELFHYCPETCSFDCTLAVTPTNV